MTTCLEKINIEKLQKELEELQNKNKELQSELENKNKEFRYLQNKVNRYQKTETIPDKNVIYIITCDELLKERIYLFGKAVDLKHRLTNYNKSLEHQIIYYKSFKNIYQMRTAELMFLYKLNQYKDKHRDRFLLPEDQDISFFTNVIDEIYNWFENIENKKEIESKEDELPKKRQKFDKNSVYLLTSEIHLKTRTYIIGKSKNLNSRLSAYNKGFDHIVVYNKKCNNINQMGLIEQMILYKLDSFRERMNRDRFILPEDKDVSFFTNIFDTAVNWFNDIDSTLEIVKDEEEKKQDSKDTQQVYNEEHKEQLLIKKKKYNEEHKEKKAETDKKYREEHKEELIVKNKEYRDTHKEKISETKKNWYKKNKEDVIERVKNNYENNKEQKLAKVKEYAENNKDKIKEQQSLKIKCECRAILRKYGMGKHVKTLLHKKNLEKIDLDFLKFGKNNFN